MKGVLVILDGVGDLPHKALNNMTPLEAAETPNLDFLANRGELGWMHSVKPNYVPGSDEAIVSIFGNELSASSRGQLETRGTNIKLTRGDLALRVNFATIDSLEKGNIIDRRAGRTLTSKEAELLSKDLNKIEIQKKFVFKNTIQHRGVLVIRGGLSDDLTGNDSYGDEKIKPVKASNDEENAHYTANIVNEFLEKAHNVLENHPVNEKRKKRGLSPANYLLVRGSGIESPKLKFYRKWFSVVAMPLEVGFSKTCGMKVFSFNYPKLKNFDVYDTLHKALKRRCKTSIKKIKKNHKKFDYAYIHIKETDIPGHDNKPLEKKKMIEHIDKTLFNFLRKFAPKKNVKVIVTADHSTPCRLKAHSSDPVPVLYYSGKDSMIKEKRFTEKDSRKGSLGKILGKELFDKTGFN